MTTPNFSFHYSPITPSTPTPGRQSNHYFFKDGSLSLQAGDVQYQVHAYLFERHSKTFANKFIAPSYTGQIINLEGVSSYDFDQLLSVLYPVNFQSFLPQSVREWASVLSLSTTWNFPSVRQLAVHHLSAIAGSADKVALGRAHQVDHWLVPAYTNLCERFEPLTMEEGDKLCKGDIIRVMSVRHTLATDKTASIDSLVRQTFGLEEDLEEDGDDGSVSPTPTIVVDPEDEVFTPSVSDVKLVKPSLAGSLVIPGKNLDDGSALQTPVSKKKGVVVAKPNDAVSLVTPV